MGTVCTVCYILDIVILKENPPFIFMEWASFFKPDLKKYYVILKIAFLFFKSVYNIALKSIR